MGIASRTQLGAWIRAGHVELEGCVVRRPSTKVRPGQRLTVRPPVRPPLLLTPQPEIPFDVVYADDDLAVVNKPAGLVVHPGAGHPDGTLINGVLGRLGGLSSIGGAERPGVVHRIDAGTSGLLVVARTDVAHQHLARQFAAHSVERRYTALVWSRDVPEQGTLDTPYGRDPRNRVLFTSRAGDRRAVTHWRVTERLPPCSLLSLRLETGRTHQIRVHLSEAGCPLVGDPQYGRARRVEHPQLLRRAGIDLGLRHQALHATELGFEHPDGRLLRFQAELPSDLVRVLSLLRSQWA